MNKNKNKKQGFTLIELLVVVSIIGLLSMLSVVALGSARSKARDARRLTDIRAIARAIDLYILDHSHSPYLGANNCNAFTSVSGDACVASDTGGKWSILETELAEYLSRLPVDPCGEDCPGSASDVWFSYEYLSPANLAAYCDGLGTDCTVSDKQFDSWYKIYAQNMAGDNKAQAGFATSL